MKTAKLLFLVTEDWYFCSHRLPIARAARDAGAEVVVATRVGRHRRQIEDEGFRLIELDWRRRSRNPFVELASLLDIIRIYRRERPTLVHHVAVKPAVYGGIAAALSGRPHQVSAIAGLGYVSTSRHLRARILRPLVRLVFRHVINRPEVRVIVQNPDDAAALEDGRLVDAPRVHVIRGSGVDVDRFRPADRAVDSDPPVTAVLAGRMLWSKGIGEAVEAARLLRDRGRRLRLVLVGDPDPENPESIPSGRLRDWVAEGVVEWWGHVDDIVPVWQKADIGLLPSYREGLPKTLLEAAACGLPLIATDVPGCREIVAHEDNGLLVPAKRVPPLADALDRLASDTALREKMGARSRELAERCFAESIVVRETMALYASMVGEGVS